MSPLSDTRRVPLTHAAAVYEANGANDDFLVVFLSRHGTREAALRRRDYRDAAEVVMEREFAATPAACR